MPTYAILGATGQVGSSILDALLQQTPNPNSSKDVVNINAFVRSKQKLLSMRPALASDPNITIFQGQLTDTAHLASCIKDTRAVFLCAAAVDNVPNCSIAQEQAHAVLAALDSNNNDPTGEPASTPPKLVVLSSASLEPHLMDSLPRLFEAIMLTAASNVYADLRLAETYLRSHAPAGKQASPELIFIKPGGLVHDIPVGHLLSTTHQKTFLSFADLGAGMVEAADSTPGKWNDAKGNVSVVPAREGTRVEWYVPWYLVKGCLWHFCPGLWPVLGKWLP